MAGKTFDGSVAASMPRAFSAGVRAAAELGYQIIASNADAGVLSFNTGRSMKSWSGQEMTATFIAEGATTTKIVIGGSLAQRGNQPMQLGAWGEKGAIAKKFLEKVGAVLPSVPEPAGAVPPNEGDTRECPHCAETIKAAAKVCRYCNREVG